MFNFIKRLFGYKENYIGKQRYRKGTAIPNSVPMSERAEKMTVEEIRKIVRSTINENSSQRDKE